MASGRPLKPVVRLFILVLIAAGLYGAYLGAQKMGWIGKVNREDPVKVEEVKAAVAEQKLPTLTVCINTWGGYAAGPLYNGGFQATANDTSRFYKDGVIVGFKVIDDFKAMRDAWKAGECDVLGLATTDSLPTEITELATLGAKQFIQTDWSEGGDAMVVRAGINSVCDLKGKKVAVAIGTPSHTLLLLTLATCNLSYTDIQVVGVDNGIEAASRYKAGASDAAVVWAPDDEDCVKNVPGTKVLVNTKKANKAIADVFIAKQDLLAVKNMAFKKFTCGWLKAAGEINSLPTAKAQAAQILSSGFNLNDVGSAARMIDNARITTYGDNLLFFGLKTSPGAVRGEEVYNKMHRLFNQIDLAPDNIPLWRNIVDTSFVASCTELAGPPENAPEETPRFAPPKPEDAKAPAFSSLDLTVNFAFNSADLTDEGKEAIDAFFISRSKEFGKTRILIEGNTDSKGSREVNQKLSQERARSGANYLVAKLGLDPNRFIIVGNGPDKPVVGCEANQNEECRAKNRRTTFKFLEN